jgi:hypothetical protein
MQNKHAWDKLIPLTGNVEEDFRTLIVFLEKNNIMDPKYLRTTQEFSSTIPVNKIHLLEYKATINEQHVVVLFEKYLDTGEMYLKNGWVATK